MSAVGWMRTVISAFRLDLKISLQAGILPQNNENLLDAQDRWTLAFLQMIFLKMKTA
jgi:hypothetical protein